VELISYDLGYRTALRDVTPGPLSATDTFIVYKRYPSYAFRKHICGSGLWEGRETNKKKLSAVAHVIIVSC
jgi:hypothetical protein